MRTIIALIAAACVWQAAAGEIQYPIAQSQIIFTNSTSINLATNVSPVTNYQTTVYSTFHTFQIYYSILGTNSGSTIAVDRTLDCVNYFNVTNFTISTLTSNFEFQATGKWAQYRYRTTESATNGTLIFTYLAQ